MTAVTVWFWHYILPVAFVGTVGATIFLGAQALLQRLQFRMRLSAVLLVAALFILPLSQMVRLLPQTHDAMLQRQFDRMNPIVEFVKTPVGAYADTQATQKQTSAVQNTQATDAQNGAVHAAKTISLYEILPLVWLLGALLVLLISIVQYFKFARLLRKSSKQIPAETAKLLYRRFGCDTKQVVELRVTTVFATPVSLGFLHPCVYVPADRVKSEALPYILRHECMHIGHRHILCKLLLQAICVLQWFNPLAWMMQSQMTKACEYTCDELVTAQMNEAQRHAYGNVLLDCATPLHAPIAANAFGGAAKQMYHRLHAVLMPQKRGAKQRAAVLSALMLVLSAGLFAACAASDASKSFTVTSGAQDASMPIEAQGAGTSAPSNEKLVFYIVPDVVGLTKEEAIQTMEDSDIPYEISYTKDTTGAAAGKVVATEPAAGEQVQIAPEAPEAAATKVKVFVMREEDATPSASTAEGTPEAQKPENNENGAVFPVDRYSYITARFEDGHRGTDIVAEKGTPIYAVFAGTVLKAELHDSLGWYVSIDSGAGVNTLYAHCDTLTVTAGESVEAGQQIATMGDTGMSSGTHLHLEYSVNGTLKSPAELFPEL